MDNSRIYAYRYLIYNGMLHIRPIAGIGSRWRQRWNLVYWLRMRKQIAMAGEVANWLHNLALFSATEFSGFDETAFWSGSKRLEILFPDEGMDSFQKNFSNAIFEFDNGRWPTLDEQSRM